MKELWKKGSKEGRKEGRKEGTNEGRKEEDQILNANFLNVIFL
jgi:hypothetical protein